MSKKSPLFFLIFISVFLVSAVLVASPARAVDSGTHWLLVDATPDTHAAAELTALTELLTTRGKVPTAQIHHIAGERATATEIQRAIETIGRSEKPEDTLILLYHGPVTKPRGVNAMHLLVPGEAEGVRDATLNSWLRATTNDKTVVIIDGYTTDRNLGTYYANREMLGDAALNVIQSAETPDRLQFLKHLYAGLAADATDTNEDRRLSIIENYEALRADAHFTEPTDVPPPTVAPIGDVEMPLLKLSPALKITSLPEGASIFVNDVAVGETPKLITENLKAGVSTVTVRRAGYRTPNAKTAELRLVLGESARLGWVLEPIAVHGTVQGVADSSPEGAVVWIDGTPHQETVDAAGNFRFAEWSDGEGLTPGESYTLYVKQDTRNYGSASFTFAGSTDIAVPLTLASLSWFEVAQLEFDRQNPQGAVTAFQNGIERTQDFPEMSPDFTALLLNSFSDALARQDVQDVTYLVVAAKLAEQQSELELAKGYWESVKAKARKGSAAAKLANDRLWDMNRGRYLLNIGLIVLCVLLIGSGVWTLYRYRKAKK